MASRRGKPNMTPEQERTLLQMVALGHYPAQAARKLGLVPSTVYMRKQRNPAFRDALEAAESGYELAMVAIVTKAAQVDHRAACWILERRFPERWARPEIRTQLNAVNLDTEELKKAFQAGLSNLARLWAPRDVDDQDQPPPPPDAQAAPTAPSGVTRS